jgi:hypothetical protein
MYERKIFTGRREKEPYIKVHGKNLYLNAEAVEKFVKDNEFAILYSDKEQKIIGLKFSKDKTSNSYPLYKNISNNKKYICGCSFIRENNLQNGDYAVLEERDGIVCGKIERVNG